MNDISWNDLNPAEQHAIAVLAVGIIDSGRGANARSLDRQRSGLGDDAREIEQLLAQFANQAQAEP